jgi:hypothetical protein
MDELLNNLRTILKEEGRLDNAKKDLKAVKDGILDKLLGLVKADNFSNEFVTLRKKLSIKVKDDQIAAEFMKEVMQVDKKMVEDYFYAGKQTPGIDAEVKLVAYKKKGTL